MTFLFQVLLLIACIAGAAFFAAFETALMSVSLSTWERLRHENPRLAAAYTLWSENPSSVIACLLFGNTLMSLGASVLASALLRQLDSVHPLSTGIFLVLASLLAGSLILVFGEVIPKLYARHFHERILVGSAGPLTVMTRSLIPFFHALTLLSQGFLRLITSRPREPLITVEELRQALSENRSEGLSPSTRRILSNIMAFDRIQASDVMIPRAHIVSVRMEQNQERMFEHIVRAGFSRIPIYFGHIDNILGIVYAKDLLVEWRNSGLVVLEDLLRPPYRIVPEAPLSVLLQGFRQGHHMAVVTDAQGRTQGLVTIEDAVEAIVGDIADEFDPPQPLV